MQTKTFIAAAVATFAVFGAVAREATVEPIATTMSTVTRADVHREVIASSAAGHFGVGEATIVPIAKGVSVSRLQVAAEAHEAQRLGLLAAGEATGRMPTAAELDQIRAAGERAAGGNVIAVR
jgi:hypothetical protein